MTVRYAAACIAALFFSTPAMADEVWSTPRGDAYYSEEMEGFALFRVPWGEIEATLYFEGLAGNYDNRDIHEGYWIAPGAGDCPAALVGIDDQISTDWGRVTLVFDGPSFPTSWSAIFTTCFNNDPFSIRGDALQ